MVKAALNPHATTMTNISDEYMEDVDPSTALITMLQSEIMDMLGHMIVKRPQRQPQASGTLHKSTPFVVVLIDGNENMVRKPTRPCRSSF